MGQWAMFEEKEYETLMNATLVRQPKSMSHVRIFSPGQVLEKRLGFDFAARVSPYSRLYAQLFGPQAAYRGISGSQATQQGIPAQARFTNLFIQYKRPMEFLPGHRFDHLWPRTEEFLRFQVASKPAGQPVDYSQVRALNDLQMHFGTNAAVRYVCPAITQVDKLYQAFDQGDLVSQSAVVSVDALSQGAGYHRYWTFQSHNLGVGLPNPDGPKTASKTAKKFFQDLEEYNPNEESIEAFSDATIGSSSSFVQKSNAFGEIQHRKSRATMREESALGEQIERETKTFDAGSRDEVLSWVRASSQARDLGLHWTIAVI